MKLPLLPSLLIGLVMSVFSAGAWATATTAIAAGDGHTCKLTTAGGVMCSGKNQHGKLGDGTTTNRLTPVAVNGLSSGVVAIAAGENHTCAVTVAGAVQCWGWDIYGQLGDSAAASDRYTPVAVSGLSSGVVAIAAGGDHTCALTTAGAVQCWGANGGGLGDGTTTQRNTPVAVSGLSSGVVAIAAGSYHTCALTTAGAALCWGLNGYGQLGDGTTTDRLTPVEVNGLSSGVQSIAAGSDHTCAVTTAGALQCWGSNAYGQLGDGTTTWRNTPVAVSGLSSGVQSITARLLHTCALTMAGAVQCWGKNYDGQLGDGTTTWRNTPVAVSGLSSGVQSIAAGNAHTCAVTAAGGVMCSGKNQYGELGDGTTTQRNTPVYALLDWQSFNVTTAAPAIGLIGVSFPVAATSSSGLPVVITATGGCSLSGNDVTLTSVTPFCTVTYSQAGDAFYLTATPLSSITSVDTDTDGTANATDTDDDNDGVLDYADAMPLDANEWLDFDYDGIGNNSESDDDNDTVLDADDNCLLRANSTQADSNVDGQGDVCEPSTIAAGSSHTCKLTAAGGVMCSGNNQYGQLGDGTHTNQYSPVAVSGLNSGVLAITVGWYHTCALTTAGAVLCWGRDEYGQLGDGTTTDRLTPVAVSGLSSGVVSITAESSHTCAVTTAGAVQCWGRNDAGQLGDGTNTTRYTPVAVSGLSSGVQAIDAGESHTCALTTAGAVRCWGYNYYGQLGDGTTTNRWTPIAVSDLSSGVVAIAAGDAQTCALTVAGAVKCWGANYSGQLGDGTTINRYTPETVSGLSSGVQSIATGRQHTCALTTVGAMQCWGYNDYGQLGDGTNTTRYTPVAVSGLSSGVVAIAAGLYHTCAVTTVGAAQCWGYNTSGQLGDGTGTNRYTPTYALLNGQSFSVAAPALGVIGVSFPVTATSSSGLPVVITATGGCSLSGNDVTLTSVTPFCTVTYSQAGDAFYLPATQFSITSVDTDGDGTANATDTDDDNDGVLDYKDAMPLDASDWLDADYDGIGNSLDNDDDNDSVLDGSDNCPVRANPAQADSNSNGTGDVCEQPTIASGFFHTCAVTTAGALQCWGSNAYGQLGDGTTTSRTTPVTVSGLSSGAVAIAAGEYHTCALTVAGAVKCWGANTSGQLGDGTTVNRYTPVTVSGLSSGVVAVVAGRSHTCALTTAGAVWCWGKNYDGQLGDGTFTYRNTPVAVSGLSSGVAAIAAGDGHTCALTTAGAVLCWGRNVSGQLGDGTTMGRLTPVAVSGLNSAVVAIATGASHSCALTTTGAVRCWGYNYYGQLGDGTTMGRLTPVAVSGLSNTVEAIATGSSHNCALTTAGAVRCWGYNYYGQLGDGTTMDRLTLVAVSGLSNTVAAIATGYAHSCALTTAGALRCWGRNFEGQLGDGTTTQRHTPVFVLRDGDGDGVLDAVDAFPYDVGETLDTDNDGIGNNADHDDDGDGTPDVIDLSPLNSAVSENDLPLNGNYKGSTIRDKVQVK